MQKIIFGARFPSYLVALLFVIWFFLHLPAVQYGTSELPLHMSYIGDEQAPVNGALHILEDKSLFGLRNLTTVYYGPVFSVLALPAVIGDFATHLIRGDIAGAQDYKSYLLYDWGGIIFYMRLTAVLAGFAGVVFLFKILTTKTINPSSGRIIPWIGVFLLAGNFMYFEYASFFRHWIFIIALLLGQIYYLIKIDEGNNLNVRYYWLYEVLLTVTSFGISYVGAIFQVLWIPVLARWAFGKKMKELKFFMYYIVSITILGALVVWWHPYAFFRILGLTGVIEPLTSLGSILEPSSQSSFAYYVQILFLNNLALLSAGIILVGFIASQALIRHAYWIWVFILPAIASFTVFSLPTHHEGRYVLPTVVLLVACVAALFVHAASRMEFRGVIKAAVVTLLFSYLVFQVISIGQWLRVMNDGPSERSAIARILELQKTTPEAKTLALHGYLFGYTHTKDAYMQYAKQTHKENVDLYKTLIQLKTSPSPKDLNVYYKPLNTPITKDLIKNFDHIVIRYIPEVDYDPFDTNMLNLWFYEDFADSFTFLK